MRLHTLAKAITIATLLASPFVTVCAETVSTTPDLANNKKTISYLYSRTAQETLFRLGVEQDKKFGLQQDCKSQYRVGPYSIGVLQPIVFPDDKAHPTKGVWNIRYQLQRCGESKFYNAIFMASGNGDTPAAARAYYPGTTNAGPVLVKDAMMGAFSSAMLKSNQKECKDVDVFDMRVSEQPHDMSDGTKTYKGVWSEIWTFRLCSQMVDVGVTFIPDATGSGTSYVITPVK